MMHVAMFEAVNAIERRYVPYRLKLVADRKTSGETAAAVAGHDVLAALYPDQKSGLDALLAETLNRVEEGAAKERGIILGRKAAADILELRGADGSEVAETYRPVHAARRVRAHGNAGRVDGERLHALGDVERRAVPSRGAARIDLGNLDARSQRDSRDRRAQQQDAHRRSRPTSENSGS